MRRASIHARRADKLRTAKKGRPYFQSYVARIERLRSAGTAVPDFAALNLGYSGYKQCYTWPPLSSGVIRRTVTRRFCRLASGVWILR